MKYRKFGSLDWESSILGFGVMRLPVLHDDPSYPSDPSYLSNPAYLSDSSYLSDPANHKHLVNRDKTEIGL